MRRVWMTGGAVALGDGVLLGTSAALGWTVVSVLAVLIGVAGALRVALATPSPRPAARQRPATVTLGVPMRDVVEEPATAVEEPRTIVPVPAREAGAAPVAA